MNAGTPPRRPRRAPQRASVAVRAAPLAMAPRQPSFTSQTDADRTEPTQPLPGRPYGNRAGATDPPAPQRRAPSAQPSPRRATQALATGFADEDDLDPWDLTPEPDDLLLDDVLAPQASDAAVPRVDASDDEGVTETIEIDAAWRDQLARIAAAFADEDTSTVRSLAPGDLQLDPDDLRNRARAQTSQPAPLALPLPPPPPLPLAARSPRPAGTQAHPLVGGPAPSRVAAPAPIVGGPRSVTAAVRARHAAEHVGWFLTGAVLTFGTGSVSALLLAAVLLLP